jgi:hypothetical protein
VVIANNQTNKSLISAIFLSPFIAILSPIIQFAKQAAHYTSDHSIPMITYQSLS